MVQYDMCCSPAGVEKLLVHRGRIVPLLDQFDLQVAGIRQRNAHLQARIFTAVPEIVGLDPVDIEPGANAHHVDPVIHGGADVPHHIPVLSDGSEDTTHNRLG